jgi:hypothetical protein
LRHQSARSLGTSTFQLRLGLASIETDHHRRTRGKGRRIRRHLSILQVLKKSHLIELIQ